MKVKHDFKQGLEQIFFIQKESIQQLLDGKDNIELILDFRKNELLSESFLEAMQESRCGFCKDGSLSFPKEHLDLIIKRYREGKIKGVIFIKADGPTVVDVNDIDLGIEVEEQITYQDAFVLDNKYVNVCSEITNCFPGLKENERAYLVYLSRKKASSAGNSSIKIQMLNHLNPWNIDQQLLDEIIKNERIAIFVTSSKEESSIYLTEKCARNLIKQGIKAFAYSVYAPHMEEKGEHGAILIFPQERGIYVFSEVQYEVVKRMGMSIVYYKNLLGKENLLVGGMFSTDDKKFNTSINTISIKRQEYDNVLLFYFSKLDQNCFFIKCVNKENVKNISDWKKIEDEGRLMLIFKQTNESKVLIKKEFFENNLPLKKLMSNSLFPVIIDINNKFIFKEFFRSCELLLDEQYEKLVQQLNSFVEKKFDKSDDFLP